MAAHSPAPLLIAWTILFIVATPACLAQTNQTGVGLEIASPSPLNLTNSTVWGYPLLPDSLADYVVRVRSLLTGASTTTPKPSDEDGGLGVGWILLIVFGSLFAAAVLGLMIYNTVVARQLQDMTKTPASQAGGAYVKVIQVDLTHA
jgi:hypothetical protein